VEFTDIERLGPKVRCSGCPLKIAGILAFVAIKLLQIIWLRLMPVVRCLADSLDAANHQRRPTGLKTIKK
jgi:hypothetical protein